MPALDVKLYPIRMGVSTLALRASFCQRREQGRRWSAQGVEMTVLPPPSLSEALVDSLFSRMHRMCLGGSSSGSLYEVD